MSLGSLIEVVNRFGSFFYGSILGVFLLAMIPRVTCARARSSGCIAGISVVGAVNVRPPEVAFLWHNVIGAVTVVIVGLVVSAFQREAVRQAGLRRRRPDGGRWSCHPERSEGSPEDIVAGLAPRLPRRSLAAARDDTLPLGSPASAVRLRLRSVLRPPSSGLPHGTTVLSGAFAASRFTNRRAAPGTPLGS